MANPKIVGHCSCCDCRCFEVMSVFEAHERYPGEPKQIGPAESHAVRLTFLLMGGEKMGLTFCENCADSLSADQYAGLWDRVVVSWARETKGEIPDWFEKQLQNQLLCIIGRESWQQVISNG